MRYYPFLLTGLPIFGQTITGTIVGSARDPSALPVAGASVTLTWQAATDALGDFRFTNVTPGVYKIAVKAEGFKVAERTKLGAFCGRDVADG